MYQRVTALERSRTTVVKEDIKVQTVFFSTCLLTFGEARQIARLSLPRSYSEEGEGICPLTQTLLLGAQLIPPRHMAFLIQQLAEVLKF